MPTFTEFSDILPDPVIPISQAGTNNQSNNGFDFERYGGAYGPGFSAVNFSSVTNTQVSRTMSGRGVTRDGGSQHWEFSLSYNPMFRHQFDVIDSFLSARNPRKEPFYVLLPQYTQPKDTDFAYYHSNDITAYGQTIGIAFPGDTAMFMKGIFFAGEHDLTNTRGPKPGDMFNIVDPNNYNHQKVCKVTRIETNDYYQAGTIQPPLGTYRVHFTPPLQKRMTQNSPIRFDRPLFRVIAKGDVQEYQLNTEGLYSFSLALEEIQP